MAQLLLVLTGALVVGAIVFGVAVLITGSEGLGEVEPDGRSVSLTDARPLVEHDFSEVQFDTVVRGYRMSQVDQALRRSAYDIGYKSELIGVLEAEIDALREGRLADADALRSTRDLATGSAQDPGVDMDGITEDCDVTVADEADADADAKGGADADAEDVKADAEGGADTGGGANADEDAEGGDLSKVVADADAEGDLEATKLTPSGGSGIDTCPAA